MSKSFSPTVAGSALPDAPAPATPRQIRYNGGDPNPSLAELRSRFGEAILRSEVVWGETTVYVERSRLHDIVQWLHDDPGQRYDYLSDVTGVEYRDRQIPLQVVWHLRSLPYRRFIRLKVEIARGEPLEVSSVFDIYRGADWLERECYDMFGIVFAGHPDLRRILMWERYAEGYPLRKDFPLRGRFSRSEQLRQALAANPEARYSMEELTIAQAFEDLPEAMRRRLTAGEETGE